MSAPPIPVEALANHIAILGKTGSGKSNAAKTLVEAALDRGERICVLDPTGAWYGLRLTAKGKASPYPVVIFGGQHADLQIGPAHGAAIAEMVGTTSTPAVIDTRLMTVGERTRFFTDFAETLLRKNSGPLTLVIDEAHLFAPQGRVADPQSGKMLHAANNLVSLGRSIGLRVIMLSQRPAKLHKDSLTQVETLVAMRLIAPHDVAAVDDWIGEWADKAKGKEITRSLPSLPTGDAWVWSPEIGVLHRAHFPLARTFDSGKAPVGGGEKGPGLAPLDLAAVTARLDEVAADVMANDPRTLRAENARLAKELKTASERVMGGPDQAALLAADAQAEQRGYERGVREGEARGIAAALDRMTQAIGVFHTDPPSMFSFRASSETAKINTPARAKPARLVLAGPSAPVPATAAEPAMASPGVATTASQQKVLNALAWWGAFGIAAPTNEQVGFIAGYAPGSGNFNNLKGGLRSAGLIEYPQPGRVSLTADGLATARSPDVGDLTEAHFHGQVRAKLSASQLKLFDPVLAAYPGSLPADEVAQAAGYAAGSGNFNNLRGSLRTINLIEYPAPGQVRAASWLFP